MRLLRRGEQQHLGDTEKFYALTRQLVVQLPGIDEGLFCLRAWMQD
jgi:hypothetical protein